jgi:hypothetical protein
MGQCECDRHRAPDRHGPHDFDPTQPECGDPVGVGLHPQSQPTGEIADAPEEQKREQAREDEQGQGEDVLGDRASAPLHTKCVIDLRRHPGGINME